MTRIVYKVGEKYTTDYAEAMDNANGNAYLLERLYVELGDNDSIDDHYTVEELVEIYTAHKNRKLF